MKEVSMRKQLEEESWLSLENFFVGLTEDWFWENYELGGFETRSREGVFSPVLTMWLMLLQRFQQRHSLSGALEALVSGKVGEVLSRNNRSKRVRRGELSASTGGFCKARQQLSLEKVNSVAELVNKELAQQSKGEGLWHGKAAYFIDGTTITLSRTDSILEKYPSNICGKRDAHFPQLRCLCMHNVINGLALSPSYAPLQGEEMESEQALTKRMLSNHKEPSIIVGDRNFGIFSMVYHANKNGHEVLFRIKESQFKKLLGTKKMKAAVDQEVVWEGTKSIFDNNPEIPVGSQVKGRIIRKKINRDGFKPLELFLFTTCSETSASLVGLYGKRELIENDIRSLKYTLGMEMLHAHDPDVLEKELILGVVAYNLIRACLAKAAKVLGIEPRRISFSRGAEYTRIFGNKIAAAQTCSERKLLISQYFKVLGQCKLPNRKKQRIEPRKVVRRKLRYPVMKKSREQERMESLQSQDKATG
ncbi:IS4 family transposase [bacterium]|nr:IS4 family transposase [bacterium]